jgi:hypothetical protein
MTDQKPTTPAEVANAVAGAAANMREALRPVEEAARGYKLELEQHGWSPTAAEQVAVHWIISMQTIAFTHAGRSKSDD